MTAGGNRNVLNRPLGDDGQRDWSYGLFDCTDECGLCMSTGLVKLPYDLAELLFSGRLLLRCLSLRGLFQEQTAPSPIADSRHPSPRWG